MKVKTAEATGLQLDWGVAVVETQNGAYHECGWDEADGVWVRHFGENPVRFDHTDPAVCMGLIEQYSLAFSECDTRHLYDKPDTLWRVACRNGSGYGESKVLAQAVARCVIAMKLGDEFECPSELWVQS